jgi:hypothetical protein
MIRHAGMIVTFLSALFFPWQLTAFLALIMAMYEPWVPVAVGLFVDTLYYVPHGSVMPIFTISGVLVTALSFFVRSRLKTGSIER